MESVLLYLDTMLTMLKTDLSIRTSTLYDDRLAQLIIAGAKAIIEDGASDLDASDPLDQQIIVMYAAWLWRRRDQMTGMPRMLRLALNNRVFGMVGEADG